jgi:hypothetical protein
MNSLRIEFGGTKPEGNPDSKKLDCVEDDEESSNSPRT